MDLKQAIAENGNPVWLYTCNCSDSKNWILDSYGRLRSQVDENYCIEGGRDGNLYQKLFVYKCNDALHQRWTVTDDGRIKKQGHGKYIGAGSGCGGVASERVLELHSDMSGNDRQNCRDQQRWQTSIDSAGDVVRSIFH